jgi:hypothetical protein
MFTIERSQRSGSPEYAGRLAYWGTHAGPAVEIWALQSSRRLISAKVRAFLDMLDKAFSEKVLVPPN